MGDALYVLGSLIKPMKISGMSVDSVNRRLYFADSGNGVISSVALDGSDYKNFFTAGNLWFPFQVIVVPSLG